MCSKSASCLLHFSGTTTASPQSARAATSRTYRSNVFRRSIETIIGLVIVSIERLQAFYRNYYQPDNAILLVAGKFDEARKLGLVTKYFGPIPKPQRVLQPNYTVEPTQDGERSVTLRRDGEVQGVVVAYHLPAGSHPDFAALDVAAEILGDSPSGRLYKALVGTKKAANVACYTY